MGAEGGFAMIGGLGSGSDTQFSIGSMLFFFGFVGAIVSKIGSWLSKP